MILISLYLILLDSPVLPCPYGYLTRAVLNALLDCRRPLICDTLLSLQSLSTSNCFRALYKLDLWVQFPLDPQGQGTDPIAPILKANPGRKNPSCACVRSPHSRLGSTSHHSGFFPTSLKFVINSWVDWLHKYLLSADNVEFCSRFCEVVSLQKTHLWPSINLCHILVCNLVSTRKFSSK